MDLQVRSCYVCVTPSNLKDTLHHSEQNSLRYNCIATLHNYEDTKKECFAVNILGE